MSKKKSSQSTTNGVSSQQTTASTSNSVTSQTNNTTTNYWEDIIHSTIDVNTDSSKAVSDVDNICYIVSTNDEGTASEGFNTSSGGAQFSDNDIKNNSSISADDLYAYFSGITSSQVKNDTETADFTLSDTDKNGFLGSAANNNSFKFINDYDGLNINWDYTQFFNDRDKWQKGTGDITSEPNWLYFKVFFDFNTTTGLFGGIVNEKENNIRKISATSALGFYLQWAGHYMAENANGRMVSLQKFVKTLNYVSNYAPWFFDSIEGLDSLKVDLNEPFKDRVIKIKCKPDAIDMRLTTMFDLYKFACFDYVNFKEMLPENLRKFNMSILFFSVPTRYIDTHSKIGSNEYGVRTVKENNDGLDMMCKIINFKNCEFVVDGMFNTPSSISNESPFNFSGSTINIKYQKSFEEIVNPYFNLRQTSFGIKSINSDIPERLRAIGGVTNLISNTAGSKSSSFLNTLKSILGIGKKSSKLKSALSNATSNALIDETEALCQNLYESVQASRGSSPELGNIYDSDSDKISDYASITAYGNSVITKTGKNLLSQLGNQVKSSVSNALKGLFGSKGGSSVGYDNFSTAPTHVLKMAQKLRSGSTIKNFSVYDNTGLSSAAVNANGDEIAYPASDGSAKVVDYVFHRNNSTSWTSPKIVNGLPQVIRKDIETTSKGKDIKNVTANGAQTKRNGKLVTLNEPVRRNVTLKTPNGRTKTLPQKTTQIIDENTNNIKNGTI